MTNKIILACIVLSMGVLAAHTIPIKPVITIINHTGKPLFIYAGESMYNVDPAPDEVESIVKSKPDVIASGKKIELTTSVMSLIRTDTTIDIGWRIGGQYEYNSSGGGGQNFIFSSTEGACSVSIEVMDSFNNEGLESFSGGLCLKKLKVFSYKY